MVNQDEAAQEELTEPGTPQDHQRETHLYEEVDEQPETSVCVIGTEGQGHYENRGVNEDQDGYVPMNREFNEQDGGYVLPMNRQPEICMGVIEPESQGHYENRGLMKTKTGMYQ